MLNLFLKIGAIENFDSLGPFMKYIHSLYWSLTTITTVGYGDITPVNGMEMTWVLIFELFNIALMAYSIGTITLIIVKGDTRTGRYLVNKCHI